MSRRLSGVLMVLATAPAACSASGASHGVYLERVPGGGIQPQAVTDSTGLVHIVYFAGDQAAGDIYYVSRTPNGEYSKPHRVNSEPGGAVAIGTVRGAQLALGRRNRVHVVWNGSDRVEI